jgi:hypothetical protein
MRKPVVPARGVPARAKSSRLARWRQSLANGVMLGVEGVAGLGCLAGAPLLAATGKWAAGAVLGVVALGIFLRFAARKHVAASVAAQPPASPWLIGGVALLSAAETALLVEATGLPVRYGQPDFSQWNWLWVLAAFAAFHALQSRWLARRKPGAAPASASHTDDTRPI